MQTGNIIHRVLCDPGYLARPVAKFKTCPSANTSEFKTKPDPIEKCLESGLEFETRLEYYRPAVITSMYGKNKRMNRESNEDLQTCLSHKGNSTLRKQSEETKSSIINPTCYQGDTLLTQG